MPAVTLVLFVVFLISLFTWAQYGKHLPDGFGWGVFALFIVFLVLPRVGGRRSQRGVDLNSEGARLLSHGRIALALEKFEAARPLLGRGWKAAIAFNIGLCQMELWRLNAAELEFSRALDSKRLSKSLQPQLLPRYALLAALRGDLQGAAERSARALRLNPDSSLLVLMDAVLECRQEEWDQARTLLEDPAHYQLGGPLRGLRDALLCWCVEHTSGERRYLDRVTVFGEASTDKLRESWPELVDFLLQHSPS